MEIIIIAIAALVFGASQLFAKISVEEELSEAKDLINRLKQAEDDYDEMIESLMELVYLHEESLKAVAGVLTKADVKKYNKKLKKKDFVITHEVGEFIDFDGEFVTEKYNAVSRISEIEAAKEVCDEDCGCEVH